MSSPNSVPEITVQVGDLIAGKYRVERVLGSGGMGTVVAALHLDLDEIRAIKLMHPVQVDNAQAVERFLREARLTVRLRSEHIPRLYDVGRLESGAPYIVMEVLQGSDLRALIKGRGMLPIEEAILYVLQTCEAVAEAHAAGIVHRDLKPANLFLTTNPDGSPCIKVLDFGISKLLDGASGDMTKTLDVLGSIHYMAPEQLRSSRSVDARADIWSLGVILYRLLTGRLPFQGDTPVAYIMALREDLHPPSAFRSDLPTALDAAVMRCLEKDPERRTPTVAALIEAITPFGPQAPSYSDEYAQSPPAEPTGAGGAKADAGAKPTGLNSMLMTQPMAVGGSSAVARPMGGTQPIPAAMRSSLSYGAPLPPRAPLPGPPVPEATAPLPLAVRSGGRVPLPDPSYSDRSSDPGGYGARASSPDLYAARSSSPDSYSAPASAEEYTGPLDDYGAASASGHSASSQDAPLSPYMARPPLPGYYGNAPPSPDLSFSMGPSSPGYHAGSTSAPELPYLERPSTPGSYSSSGSYADRPSAPGSYPGPASAPLDSMDLQPAEEDSEPVSDSNAYEGRPSTPEYLEQPPSAPDPFADTREMDYYAGPPPLLDKDTKPLPSSAAPVAPVAPAASDARRETPRSKRAVSLPLFVMLGCLMGGLAGILIAVLIVKLRPAPTADLPLVVPTATTAPPIPEPVAPPPVATPAPPPIDTAPPAPAADLSAPPPEAVPTPDVPAAAETIASPAPPPTGTTQNKPPPIVRPGSPPAGPIKKPVPPPKPTAVETPAPPRNGPIFE